MNDTQNWINKIKKDPIAHVIAFHKDFTEKLTLLSSQCYLTYSVGLEKEEILSYRSRIATQNEADYIKIDPQYDFIYIDQHALDRWNERVGPPMNQSNLERILYYLLSLNRIQFTAYGWGIIDNDVVFGYSLRNHSIVFHTFLGRVSLKPGLLNYSALLGYNEKTNDQLDLFVPPDLIQQQLKPIIPKEIYVFQGSTTCYYAEEYLCNNDQVLFLISKSGEKNWIEIDFNNPFIPLLSKSVLKLLLMKNQFEFVVAHLAYHKPEKLQKMVEKRKEKMRKRGEPIPSIDL